MNYQIYIYTLNAPNNSSTNVMPNIYVGADPSANDLFLLNIDFSLNITSFSSAGNATIVGFGQNSPRTGLEVNENSVQSGDIIHVYENGVIKFKGYVLVVRFKYNNPIGSEVMTIEFDTLLSHFTRQNMIQSFQNVTTLTPKGVTFQGDILSNKIRFGDLLSFMQKYSIYNFAEKINPDIITPKYLSPSLINADTMIYYYASPQSTKENVLLTAVFFYQVLIWQDEDGIINIGTPNIANQSYLPITKSDPSLRDYETVAQEAALTNNIVESLYYAGIFPPTSDKNGSTLAINAIPDQNNFYRSWFLYNTQFFSQVQLIIENIQGNVITDPLLLELTTSLNNAKNKGVTVSTPGNTLNLNTMISLLAYRNLAQSLTYSTSITVELNRNTSRSLIPINQVIEVNNVQYYCIKASIILSTNGDNNVENTIQLEGVPLYSITGGWNQV